ncbi:uncharacterized protein Spt20 isoform X3 [Euwallacea similis]|uniref:uncharacterized protein Spt20 isoform X3 n=1 Tax=Euwallacea similis TaxID=1736056 RepID=UPI00344B1ED2
MQRMEAACDEGESVKKLKVHRAAALPLTSPKEENQASTTCDFETKSSKFDIFEELQKLCDEDEESSDEDDDDENDHEQVLQYKPLILERLVKRDKLNTVILNLYAGNKGYSLAFRLQDRSNKSTMYFKEECEELIQTMTRGYEEDTILRYLDKEEIPPFILDALDKFDFIFYSGCVIAEVRNYRRAYPENKCYVHHVLLRPTQKTVLADINTLTQHRTDFSPDDRDFLESQIVIAHTPELCLDPDPHLENKVSALHNRTRLWNDRSFRKMSQKASQMAATRKRKLGHFAKHHGLEILDFCKAKKSKLRTRNSRFSQVDEAKTVIPAPVLQEPSLDPPTQPVEIGELRSLVRPEVTSDCTLYRIEDHILETDIKDQERTRIYHITLSIFYRPSNMEFWGELYLDRDFKRGERTGTFCRFYLGTRTLAHSYVYQFTEIFTESGRKMNIRVRSVVHINSPEEVIWPSNAFTSFPQRLPNPKEHMERMNRAMQALSYDRTTNLQYLVEKVFKGDLEADVYNQTDLKSFQMTSQELAIDALATKLELSSQRFQAAEKAKRQAAAAATQQKMLANSNIISLLNSSPASNVNNDASAAVVNAINNSTNVVSNQRQLLARRMTLSNLTAGGARMVSHGNIIAVNNHNRLNLQELNSPTQTVTLSSVSNQASSGTSYTYTAVPIKQPVAHHQRIAPSTPHDSSSESALGALLVGTPAADRPEIASPNHENTLLLEKLAASCATGGQNPFAQSQSKLSSQPHASAQFVVQNATKSNAVISPMSSPPPQTSSTTLNVQSLDLSQLQSIPGLHNVQFQLQNFSQPISLAVNVGGQISGSGTPQGQLLMSLPTAQTQQTVGASSGVGQAVQVINAGGSTSGPSHLTQLASSGAVKNVTHHNVRMASGSQTLQLTPGSHPFQLISQLQRPTRQETLPTQATISGRTLQRTTPITIKMAPNSNLDQQSLEAVHEEGMRELPISMEETVGTPR